MSKIIGIANNSFDTKDGTHIEGKTVYFTDPLDSKQGVGVAADKVFLTAAKLVELNFNYTVGDEIELLYNKFGKIQKIRAEDGLLID